MSEHTDAQHAGEAHASTRTYLIIAAILDKIASAMTSTGQNNAPIAQGEYLVALCPEHAATCAAGAAPQDAGEAPSGVRAAQREGRTFVRYGEWIVVFGEGEPQVRPAKPEFATGHVYLAGADDAGSPADG